MNPPESGQMDRDEVSPFKYAVGAAMAFSHVNLTAGDVQELTKRLHRALMGLPADLRMEAMGMVPLGGQDPNGRKHYVEVGTTAWQAPTNRQEAT